MKLIIYLPKMTGFDIEVDGHTLHSKYSNIIMDVQLNEGKHVVSTLDQAPTPTFWNKIIGFFILLISQSIITAHLTNLNWRKIIMFRFLLNMAIMIV